MDSNASSNKKTKKSRIPRKFHERFNIEVDLKEARRRFVNRLVNLLAEKCPNIEDNLDYLHHRERREIANVLGSKFVPIFPFSTYVGKDFFNCLLALEAIYRASKRLSQQGQLDEIIEYAISESETDLGIRWRKGIFLPSGAKLLDEVLVNVSLQWLCDPKYHDVLVPFQRGLSRLLEASKNPERLLDTIRDMYEALEKMARIICGNNKNLKANAEKLVSNLSLSSYYSKMLKDYTEFAHEFRHAVKEGKNRESPSPQEAEAFVYMTGLFIRLAVESQP